MNKILDGNALAQSLREDIRLEIQALPFTPTLKTILVGKDPASMLYVTNKIKAAEKVGIQAELMSYDVSISQEDLISRIHTLNNDPEVDGILDQLPLPPHIDRKIIFEALDPKKDVDGFHPLNRGRLVVGSDTLIPCTPLGCLALIHTIIPTLQGLHAVVVGRSEIVGKPMAQLLLTQDCTVTTVHSHTRNPENITRLADILVTAAGRPHMVSKEWVKEGAIVIDVGITRQSIGGASRLVGDVDFNDVFPKVRAITPVPGGVGPMTITYLLKNTLKAALARRSSLLR